jgi:hypothetical protein
MYPLTNWQDIQCVEGGQQKKEEEEEDACQFHTWLGKMNYV